MLRLLLVKENMSIVVVVVGRHAMVTWAPPGCWSESTPTSTLLVRVADMRRTIQRPQDPRRQGWVEYVHSMYARESWLPPTVSWYWRTPPFCWLFVSLLCCHLHSVHPGLNWAPISSFPGFTCYLRHIICCASLGMFLLKAMGKEVQVKI